MHSILSADDALAVLNRSQLPTVVTEGSDDYRVMRKIEERLSDCDIDFLPVGGKDKVLYVWENLPMERKLNTLAIVDLDKWLYLGIPDRYVGNGLMYTVGYSIENDIFMDASLIHLCDNHELVNFMADLRIVCAHHAREIGRAIRGETHLLKKHVNHIIADGDITPSLDADELARKSNLERHFGQALRGKTLLEVLVRQTNRAGRFAKFGYKHIYEMGSCQIGKIFEQMERDIRSFFCCT